MQRGKVLNLSKLKFTTFILENRILIVSLIVFLTGIILGITVFKKYNNLTEVTVKFLTDYIGLRITKNFLKIFLSSLFSCITVLLVFLIFGSSMFGVVIVPISLCVCGIFFGRLTSYLYASYALKGIAFNAVILIPSSIIFLVSLLFACKEAINFSLKISGITLTKAVSYNLSNQFKRFLTVFLILVGISIISAFLDALISCGFIKYFQF